MKLVTTLFTLAFALNASQAMAKGRTESISSMAAQLGQLLGNSESVTQLSKGSSARALIVQKYLKDNRLKKIDEDFSYTENVTSIQETDWDGRGTATLDAAQNFVSSVLNNQLNTDEQGFEISEKDLAKKEEQAMGLLERLEKAGAVFGYDANGSGVCGVNYTTLYVIDVLKKAIHEYVVVQGPC